MEENRTAKFFYWDTSVDRLDCLVSWNFKHIVNFDKIKLFNSINLKLGYSIIDIRTPLEFLKYEN